MEIELQPVSRVPFSRGNELRWGILKTFVIFLLFCMCPQAETLAADNCFSDTLTENILY
jgi:hypothetical protein